MHVHTRMTQARRVCYTVTGRQLAASRYPPRPPFSLHPARPAGRHAQCWLLLVPSRVDRNGLAPARTEPEFEFSAVHLNATAAT